MDSDSGYLGICLKVELFYRFGGGSGWDGRLIMEDHGSVDHFDRYSLPARDLLLYPNSIKGLKPVEYYLPLGRISFGQPTQAFCSVTPSLN